jgi:hypothetical protein
MIVKGSYSFDGNGVELVTTTNGMKPGICYKKLHKFFISWVFTDQTTWIFRIYLVTLRAAVVE